MKFYTFQQNNSGGSFDTDGNMAETVVIQAHSADEANATLERLGGYFDGVNSGMDCGCCGDRWYPCNERDGEERPSLYGKEIAAGEKVKIYYKPVLKNCWQT